MRQQDFMTASDEAGPWGEAQQALDVDLVEQIHAGTQKQTDIEVAVPLAHLVHDEYEGYGTGGKEQISNLEARGALSALRAVTARLAVPFDPPFTDFSSFETYWKRNGGYANYQAHRDMLVTLFEPLHERLADLESGSLRSVLAEPVSPRPHWLGSHRRGDRRTAPPLPSCKVTSGLQQYRQRLRSRTRGALRRCVRSRSPPAAGGGGAAGGQHQGKARSSGDG